MKIERIKNEDNVNTDVERLKIPFVITDLCPECGTKCYKDLSGDHCLSYSKFGSATEILSTCYNCRYEWSAKVTLDVTLSYNSKDKTHIVGYIDTDGIIRIPNAMRDQMKLPGCVSFVALDDGTYLIIPEEVMKKWMSSEGA